MPFIRGRYHINPVMGEALEAARDAEAALLALEQKARQNGDAADGDTSNSASGAGKFAKGPVHRVEIEAAEMVPSHSGRAQRGYAMRLHRSPFADPGSDGDVSDAYGGAPSCAQRDAVSRLPADRQAAPGQSDTHIFSNHNDLLDFLREELTKDSTTK